MKRMPFLQTLIFIFLCSSFSFSKIHYVSNDGSINGNGSLTNPFNQISTAYNAAVLNGQNEVIKLLPGNYYESEILIFNNKKISISGYGDQSIINNNIIVKSDMSFANLYIQGSFSNESFVVFDNVKCDDTDIDLESISGTWRGNENEIHINFLSDPIDGMEAVNLDSVNTHVSNYIAKAGLATEDNINTEIAARETADSQLSSDIISAIDVAMDSTEQNFISKSGDTVIADNFVLKAKEARNSKITIKGYSRNEYMGAWESAKVEIQSGESGNVFIKGGPGVMNNSATITVKGGDQNMSGGDIILDTGLNSSSSEDKIILKTDKVILQADIIDANGAVISNVAAPTFANHAANMAYVDTLTNRIDFTPDKYVKKIGGLMTGPLNISVVAFANDNQNAAAHEQRDYSGRSSWLGTRNILVNDNAAAVSHTVPYPYATDYLIASDFGFTIPIDATILGIKAYIKRKNTSFENVNIMKNGIVVGKTKNIYCNYNDYSTESHGSENDLWGVELTAENINSANFGIAYRCEAKAAFGSVYVDWIGVEVFYKYPDSEGLIVSGNITCNDPIKNNHAATKQYVDNSVSNSIGGNYVKNNGDTMSGSITFTNRPVNGVNFHYEHWKKPHYAAYRTNRFNLFSDGNNLISSVRMWQTNSGCGYWWKLHTPVENNGNWYDALWLTRRPEYSNYTHNTALKLFHPLLMNNEQIHFLADPSDPQDAATKAYIDNKEFTSGNISVDSITETKIAYGAVTVDKLAQNVDDEYVNVNGDTMNGSLKMKTFKRQVFKFNHENRHAVGIKNSNLGNTLSFFANNIFHFNTITEDAETTQNSSLKFEIRPDSSQFYNNLYVNGDANISGTLTVPHINITGSTDWRIGSANQRSDIVIKNPNTEIRSENGDVILNASANSIVMKSPVKFSANQFGSATIPADLSTITVTDKNVSNGAVILLTPCGEVSGAPFAQINTDGTFDIKLSETVVTPTVINYLILE